MIKDTYRYSILTVFTLVVLLNMNIFVGAAQSTPLPSRNYYVNPPKWSPNGEKIAIALDNFVEVIDAATEATLFTLNGHTGTINFVSFSPDSSVIATASNDQTVKLWNGDNGALLHTLSGHEAAVTAVVWSPDSIHIVSSSFDTNPSLYIWNADTGDLLSTHNSGDFVDIAFSTDGERLGIANPLGIGALETSTFEPVVGSPRVPCCPYRIYSMVWSPDGSLWATSTWNGLVSLWDVNTGELLKQFVANSYYEADTRDVDNLGLSWVRAVTFTPDGSRIRAVSGDGSLMEWDTLTGELLQTDQTRRTAAAVWSPDSESLAVWELALLQGIPTTYSSEEINETSKLVGEMSIITPFASQ